MMFIFAMSFTRIPLLVTKKREMTFLLEVLSAYMLDEKEHKQYMEETKMLINPVERYMKNEGIKEGKREIAEKLIENGYPLEFVTEITGLSEKDILK